LDEKLKTTLPPLQKLAEVGAVITGLGLTVISEDTGAPGQACPLVVNDGIAVTVPEIGATPLLVVINAAIFPFPEVPKPIAVFVFVQEKTVPAGFAPKFIAELLFEAQIT
jgi:hypothetical protein